MKNLMNLFGGLVMFTIILSSCNKENTLENRLDGTWKIDEVKTVIQITGQPTQSATSTKNGTFHLKDDGRGLYYPYDSIGNKDYELIDWINDEETVTLSNMGTFNVKTNERKSQEWEKVVISTWGTKKVTTTTMKLSKQ